jgi:hypothetical protein
MFACTAISLAARPDGFIAKTGALPDDTLKHVTIPQLNRNITAVQAA